MYHTNYFPLFQLFYASIVTFGQATAIEAGESQTLQYFVIFLKQAHTNNCAALTNESLSTKVQNNLFIYF